MNIRLPQAVEEIINRINAAGYEAYIVGGCVRDELLGKCPNDWDITTSASPYQIKELFRRTIDTGIKHGTVTVMIKGNGYEVTTYRIDGAYEDSRHPKEVTFTSSLEEDLKRRDFTINAMAYHPGEGLVDLFGGCEDLKNGIVRCVGEPSERFCEDALRMMRAVRFAAQLGYGIEPSTFAAIQKLASTITKISAERIQTELVKLLVSDHPEKFRLLYQSGLTAFVMPEFDRAMETEQDNPHHCYTVGEHILHSLGYVRADKALRLTMLLHDLAKPVTKTMDEQGIAHFYGHTEKGSEMAVEILRRLKLDNDTIHTVRQLVRYHDRRIGQTEKEMRRAVHQIGEDIFPALFDIQEADVLAQSDYKRNEKLLKIEQCREIYRKLVEEQQCMSLQKLAVNGKDLIDSGMEPGKAIGEILKQMLEDVIEEPSHNTKEFLLRKYANRC